MAATSPQLKVHHPAEKVVGVGFVADEVHLLDRGLILEVGSELNQIASQFGDHHVVLNFDRVQYLASEMLGKLVTVRREITKRGGQLVLCQLSPVVLEVFVASHLDSLFPIVPDEASAVKLAQAVAPPAN